jgi:hypothetical protein
MLIPGLLSMPILCGFLVPIRIQLGVVPVSPKPSPLLQRIQGGLMSGLPPLATAAKKWYQMSSVA